MGPEIPNAEILSLLRGSCKSRSLNLFGLHKDLFSVVGSLLAQAEELERLSISVHRSYDVSGECSPVHLLFCSDVALVGSATEWRTMHLHSLPCLSVLSIGLELDSSYHNEVLHRGLFLTYIVKYMPATVVRLNIQIHITEVEDDDDLERCLDTVSWGIIDARLLNPRFQELRIGVSNDGGIVPRWPYDLREYFQMCLPSIWAENKVNFRLKDTTTYGPVAPT